MFEMSSDKSRFVAVCILFLLGFSFSVSTALTNAVFFISIILAFLFFSRNIFFVCVRDPLIFLPAILFFLLVFTQIFFQNMDGWSEVLKSRKLLFVFPLICILLLVENGVAWVFRGFFVSSVLVLLVSCFVWITGVSIFGVLPDNAFVFKNHITHNFLIAFFAYSCAELFLVGGRFKWVFGALFFVSVANILFMVQGRLGYLSLLVGFLVFIFINFTWRQRVLLLFVGVVSIAALLATKNMVSDRVGLAVVESSRCYDLAPEDVDYCANTSMGLRLYFYRESINNFMESPLFGKGAGGQVVPPIGIFLSNKNPHNEYLSIASQLGFVGLAVFLTWLALAARSCFKIRSLPARSILLAGVAMYAAGCIFNSLLRDFTEGHAFVTLMACIVVMSSKSHLETNRLTPSPKI